MKFVDDYMVSVADISYCINDVRIREEVRTWLHSLVRQNLSHGDTIVAMSAVREFLLSIQDAMCITEKGIEEYALLLSAFGELEPVGVKE